MGKFAREIIQKMKIKRLFLVPVKMEIKSTGFSQTCHIYAEAITRVGAQKMANAFVKDNLIISTERPHLVSKSELKKLKNTYGTTHDL